MQAFEESFFTEQLPALLRQMNPNKEPAWGLLNPQAMVEHLISSWRISNGRAKADQITTSAQAAHYKAVLLGDEPMAPNTKNPVMPVDQPPKLRKASLSEAINQLEHEISEFFSFFARNPDAQPVHPIMGPITKDEWLKFQTKHILHHLKQFDLFHGDEKATTY